MYMFTQQELMNLKALALRSPIEGKDSLAVALLLQKLDSFIKEGTQKEEIKTEDTPAE